MIIHNQSQGIDQVRFSETATSSHLIDCSYSKSVIIPTGNDVLNGRGKSANTWQGNVFYRDLIRCHKLEYVIADPEEQRHIAKRVVDNIRALSPSGRFLEVDKTSGTWHDIGDEKAILKIRQALREGASDLRIQLTPNQFGFPLQDEMSEKECKDLLEMVS